MRANVAEAALTWLSFDDKPRLLIDRCLHVLWHNEQAARALSAIPELDVVNGRLHLDHRNADRFSSEMDRLREGPRTWMLLTDDPRRLVMLFTQEIRLDDDCLTAIEIYSDGETVPQGHVLSFDQFGLTTAEKAVLQGFTDGLSPQEIAAQRGVGIETIRAQIRTLYQKLRVCSREQMFRKIAPFRR